MRTGEIKALSGLRIVAALWVVLFHFRPLLEQAAPGFRSALAPILNSGAQGVDLFFILSGFVLTWSYLDKMGPRWSTGASLRFLWLRLARVWPIYLVTMHLAALWIIFTLYVGHIPSEAVHELTAGNYLSQFFLVQLWSEPFFDGTSWNGPAWSISAEWLAYLLFCPLILVIFRIGHATRARGMLLLAVAASLPPTMLLLATGFFYSPWSWLPRIVMQFTAGALACVAVRKLQTTRRSRHVAGWVSLVLGGGIVGLLYWLDAHPSPRIYDSVGLVDLLFVPLVVSLAIGAGSLPGFLSLRPMVYLGHISFSLYMVHEIVHTAWNWAVLQFEIVLVPSLWAKAVVIGLILGALLTAAALYHFVEEPARLWMRRMVDVRRLPVDIRTEKAAHGTLKPVHEEGDTVTARAG